MSRRLARGRTTRIRVHGETWDVPFYFGVAYSSALAHLEKHGDGSLDILRDVLGLVGYDVSIMTLTTWPLRKKVEAYVFAWYEHLSAGDNPVPRHPKLDWLPEPWRGPEQEGFFGGPGPTEIRP